MNWDQIEGKWKQMKGSAKQQWGKLTDDDLDYISGSRDRFVGRLQERYGVAKEEAQKQADDWLKVQRETETYRPAAAVRSNSSATGFFPRQGLHGPCRFFLCRACDSAGKGPIGNAGVGSLVFLPIIKLDLCD
jgi:uncharacterized protein YjbJ (UPF0337 family)